MNKKETATNVGVLSDKIDRMTGLFNYDYFLLEAQRALKESKPQDSFAIFYSDILGFKVLNDLYGMEEGNRQLNAFAKTLVHPSRPGISTRIFSDLFVKLFPLQPGETGEGLSQLFETQMINFLNRQSSFHPECDLKICAGLCIVSDKTQRGLITAIDNANTARKQSREGGQTSCIFFDEVMEKQQNMQRQLAFDLQKALKQNDFSFYLQPKVNLHSGKIVGAEALSRWTKPDGTTVSPADFIPMMEKDGSIVKLDFFIYGKLADSIRRRLNEKKTVVPVSLNVSRAHLSNQNFVKQVHEIFASRKIDPSLIEFELTESMLMEKTENAVAVLNELKNYGYKASVDDFGSGYSSLSLVAKLNVDVLKLDKTLLGSQPNILTNRRRAVLTSIIEMARKLHLTVLCEGVETIEQAAYLNEIGCHLMQGFYVSRPVPETEFYQLLDKYKGYYPFPWTMSEMEQELTNPSGLSGLSSGSLASISNSIFNILPGGTMGIDPATGKILFVSDTMAELMGSPASEIIKGKIQDWYACGCLKGEVPKLRQELLNQLESEGKINFSFPFTRKDETSKWLSLRAGFTSNGEWGQYLLCFFFDETRVHRSEQVLAKTLDQMQAERNFYRGLYENVMCGIVRCRMNLLDGSTHTVSANKTAAQIFGFHTPEALSAASGGCLCDFFAKENQDMIRSRLPKLSKKNNGFSLRAAIHKGDGKEAWVDCHFQLVQKSRSNLVFQIIFLDCTDVIRQKSESNYIDSLYQQAGCGLLIHRITADNDYECVRINDEAVNLFQASSMEEYQKRFKQDHSAYFYPDDFPGVRKKLKELKGYGDSVSFYHRILLDSGEIRWVYNTVKRLADQSGAPILLGTVIDCTERKELELKIREEKEQLASLYNSTSCGILQFTWDGEAVTVKAFNKQADSILSSQKALLLEQPQKLSDSFLFLIEHDEEKITAALNKLKAKKQFTIQSLIRVSDKKSLYIESTFCHVSEQDGVKTVQCTLVDITKRRTLEAQLENYYHNISGLMHQSIFMFDFKDDKLTFYSKDKDLEYIPAHIDRFEERCKNGELSHFVYPTLLTESIYSSKETCRWNNIEFKINTQDGRTKWFSCSFYLTRDENGEPESGMGCLQDITHNVLERQRLQHLSEIDRLTGILNKATTEEKCRRFLEKETSGKSALLIMDLDNFKSTNDTHGHQFGDRVLHQFGRRLKMLFRKDDIIGRIGGDEFLILLRNIGDKEIALNRALSICQLTKDIAEWLNFPGISCSVGIALAPQHGDSYEDLLRSADKALYAAKKAGKNQFCLYEPEDV